MNFPNPLNAMQILWINIIMDGPPAQRYSSIMGNVVSEVKGKLLVWFVVFKPNTRP